MVKVRRPPSCVIVAARRSSEAGRAGWGGSVSPARRSTAGAATEPVASAIDISRASAGAMIGRVACMMLPPDPAATGFRPARAGEVDRIPKMITSCQ